MLQLQPCSQALSHDDSGFEPPDGMEDGKSEIYQAEEWDLSSTLFMFSVLC